MRPGEKVLEHVAGALVRDIREIRAGALFHHFRGEVEGMPDAARAVVQLARIALE